eukprot:gene28695-35596_t
MTHAEQLFDLISACDNKLANVCLTSHGLVTESEVVALLRSKEQEYKQVAILTHFHGRSVLILGGTEWTADTLNHVLTLNTLSTVVLPRCSKIDLSEITSQSSHRVLRFETVADGTKGSGVQNVDIQEGVGSDMFKETEVDCPLKPFIVGSNDLDSNADDFSEELESSAEETSTGRTYNLRSGPRKIEQFELFQLATDAVVHVKHTVKPPKKLSETDLFDKFFGSDCGEVMMLNESLPSHQKPVRLVSDMVAKLKPHQKEGLQFIWKNVMEKSYLQLVKEKNGKTQKKPDKPHGCLLAHCMGLGKTFSVIAFVVTLLTNPAITHLVDSYQLPAQKDTSLQVPRPLKPLIHTVLIIVPLVTLENWSVEFLKWTPVELLPLCKVQSIKAGMKRGERLEALRLWHEEGGVMIMGYHMYRSLTSSVIKTEDELKAPQSAFVATAAIFGVKKKAPSPVLTEDATAACRYLLDPGPDLVIADEAHQLSNIKSKISLLFNCMRTKRRIALTGSPLQNNLVEYWCMVNWVKHHHLYSLNRFKELFVVPITAGDKDDAGPLAVKTMRKKVHVLNKNLQSIVHRKDYSILTNTLQMKRQFVMVVHMTTFQQFLYRTFLAKLMAVIGPKVGLFKTYQCFLRLWNHPCCTVAHALFAQQQLDNKQVDTQGIKTKLVRAVGSVSVNTMIAELSTTFNHFKTHGKLLLAELESSTRAVEEKLLKPTTAASGLDDLRGGLDGEVEEDDEDMFNEQCNLFFGAEDLPAVGQDSGLKRSHIEANEATVESEKRLKTSDEDGSVARGVPVVRAVSLDGGDSIDFGSDDSSL